MPNLKIQLFQKQLKMCYMITNKEEIWNMIGGDECDRPRFTVQPEIAL